MNKIPNKVLRMKNIKGIKITVTGYTYKVGTNKIRKELDKKQYNDFCIYIADILKDTLVDAIDSQRYYNTKWPPLNVSYLKYKKINKLSLNVWEATGKLKNSITIFNKGNYVMIGFKNNDKYKDSGLSLNRVARFVEYGTSSPGRQGSPPRPLFRPVSVHIRKNISRYYVSYKKELEKENKKYLYLSDK